MIECKNIDYSINAKLLLSDINVCVEKAKILAIVGANGAGKSTLLKAMLGKIKPQSGEIFYAHKALNEWSNIALAPIRAYMEQKTKPMLNLPAYEYLSLSRFHVVESIQQCENRVWEVISKLDLTVIADKPIAQLSGGEYQRVELARAWCQLEGKDGVNNTVLILDEPASALDINQSKKLYTNLQKFTQYGGTVIVVEHDLSLAARFCDNMLLLKQGRMVANGPIEDVFTAPNINHCFEVDGEIMRSSERGKLTFSVY